MMKTKKLEREGDITGLVEGPVMGGWLVYIYVSRETFGFTNGCARFNKKTCYFEQVGRDCFATHHDSLVHHPWHVRSCNCIFVCCFIRNIDYCLGYQIAAIMTFMSIRLQRRHDLSLKITFPLFLKMIIKHVYLTSHICISINTCNHNYS